MVKSEHSNPREEIFNIIHEKEDLIDRQRRDGFENKFVEMIEKKVARK